MGDSRELEASEPWLYNGRVGRTSIHGINYRKRSTRHHDVRFSQNKRSNLEKCLFVLVAILLLVAGAFLAAFVVYYGKTEDLESICTSEECVLAAARVRSAMDMTVDPCDNFYEFACGSWMKKHVIAEDRSSLDMFAVLRDEVEVTLKSILETENPKDIEAAKKAKDLYISCVNETILEERGVQPAIEFMSEIGGWPMIDPTWREGNYDLMELLIELRKYNNAPLLNVYVGTDLKNSSSRVLYIDQPGFGMPGQKYYQRGREDEMVKAYETLITSIATELSNHTIDVTEDVRDVVDFEFILANISVPSEERRDNQALYNKYNISLLEQEYPKIDWLRMIQALMNMTDVGIAVDRTEPVINRTPQYFAKLMDVIVTTPKRTMTNYLVWRIMKNRAYNLNEKVRGFLLAYDRVLSGTSTPRARFRTCANYVVHNLGLAIGRMFVDSTFDEDSKNIANEMIINLRGSFNELLEEVDWMDESTRAVARDKADAINPKIGYPDYILNNTLLNTLYENYTYAKGLYFENVLETLKRSTIDQLVYLRTPVDRNIWVTPPSTVNAYYSPLNNQILFPAGILQPPFYSKSYPKSLNYGGIGVVIGHEITHGFDDKGRQYDKEGNLVEWWTDKAVTSFKVKAQCIIDQYSKYAVPEADMNVNGINTQGENIADNGGVKQSYKAYRKWVADRGQEEKLLPGLSYNHNQLFFINFAQIWCVNMRRENAINRILTGVHSPGRYRVIGTLQNSQEFADVFKCPRTSHMNPEKKCNVW